tara:strand:- start:25248 stop:26870 length:1623 start_codon:yes stop_codon:yes gene_type:complete
MLYVACFVVAMLIAVLLIPILMKIALPLGLVDLPNERKVHLKQTPRIGGIAICLGSIIPMLLWIETSRELTAYFLSSSVILMFGIWDDRRELNYKIKFLGQITAIAIFVIYGGIYIQWLPFQDLSISPLWISLLLTFIALLGITNAVNLVDGLDGLAGGTSLLSLSAIGVLAYLSGDIFLILFTISLCGGIFGFLRFNTHPASIFMGDTGSQFLGFSIGVAAVLLTQKSNTALSPILPLIVLGLPILDTLTVMTHRIAKGKSPFSADKNHFHHRLMALGFLHYEAVIVIYLIQISLILFGIIFRYQSDLFLLLFFIAFCLGFNLTLRFAERNDLKYRGYVIGISTKRLFNQDQLLGYSITLKSLIRIFFLYSIPLYLFFSVLGARETEGIIWLFSGMFVWSVALLFGSTDPEKNMLSRFVWYAACGLGVYCSGLSGLINSPLAQVYIGLLAICVMIYLLIEKDSRFEINPLDVIVLMFAAVMFYISRVNESFSNIGLQFTQVIVFLYAAEIMLEGSSKHRKISRIFLASIFGLSFLATFQ